MPLPDAIIFDLDGTLIHSAPDLHAAVNVALVDLGRAPLDLPTVVSFVGNGVEKLVWRSLDATGTVDADVHSRALKIFLAAYAKDMVTLTRPYAGVVECLAELREAGVQMAICTNKPEGPAKEVCAAMGLSRFMGVIAGAKPDVPKKPDAAALHAVIAKLNAPVDRTLYVGDSVVDFQTARAAGVAFRLFEGGYLNAPLPEVTPAQRFSDWTGLSFSL